MNDEKILMSEAAVLYYEKKYTQQEIAGLMGLSRQTVSKLLSDAIKEKIVEIKIHDPEKDCKRLEEEICKTFGIKASVVCAVSSKNDTLRQIMTVQSAVDYITPFFEKGGQKIAVSWGRTIRKFIDQMPEMNTCDNIVFPLFGATDNDDPCFSSNELARDMADKIGAHVKYAWFPYLPDNADDRVLIKNTSYYKKIQCLWNGIDIAVVGIGNTDVMETFKKTFGKGKSYSNVVGDISTHFFTNEGNIVDLYENALCASAENIKSARQTIALACGSNKTKSIIGALRTNIIDVLITDEHTAEQILNHS